MKKKIIFFIIAIAIVSTIAIDLQAQETNAMQTISGVITDSIGKPLLGVSITIKGNKRGVVSDSYGKYSINVPINSVLRFSVIGYIAQEIAVENKQIIDVTLEDEFSKGLQPAKPIQLSVRQNEKVEVDNSFAFRMFKEVSQQEGENTFFSPLSLNMALGMLNNGASGETHNEIVETLGIANFSETEINEYFQKISKALLNADPTTDIMIANSIWYRNNFSVKKPFVEIGNKYFDAKVQALNFNNPSAAATINDWCAEKTNNKIQNLIGDTIPDNMMMYLVNALYFKSQWQMDLKFDTGKTRLKDFTKTNKQKKKVNLMEQTSFMGYYADEHLQCIEMDYGNGAFSMVVILPSKKMKINQLVEYLDSEKSQKAIKNMRWKKVWLKLPKFKVEKSFTLRQAISDLGMTQMFSGGFLNISDNDLWVSDIFQKTFIEVNEEGTEAAAATSIMMVGASGRPKKIEPIRFFADRPFLYLIREKSTGVILFIGRMDEPNE